MLKEDWSSSNTKYGLLIQSNLFNRHGFRHGFFGKASQDYGPKELSKCFNITHSFASLNQVHSNRVVTTSELNQSGDLCADGIISDGQQESLWIYTADCIPIIFGNIKTGQVAATHAGWRGLTKNIIKETISKLKAFDSDTSNLIVALGPAISLKNYQVDKTVIDLISKNIQERKANLLQKSRLVDLIDIVKCELNTDKFLLDIRSIAKCQLKIEGIRSSNISVNKNCTYEEKSLFSSWRRDKIKSWQWSTILTRKYKECSSQV
ncbi:MULTISPECIES: peptidoglycan editing factor PgeF [Prochlorococcus]|uniref:peptidoglycan editing factor PgeF n=1 Tax=Prochlorococcus TaxID=1218 RepID=UPI0005339E59|nr:MULTISPECIES: peptidoglycan editing factor PgeF [Prochlorococcus]KGG12862.1 hypothetical protein EV05_0534 [Prochlorococcus sp. MIT 0601]